MADTGKNTLYSNDSYTQKYAILPTKDWLKAAKHDVCVWHLLEWLLIPLFLHSMPWAPVLSKMWHVFKIWQHGMY